MAQMELVNTTIGRGAVIGLAEKILLPPFRLMTDLAHRFFNAGSLEDADGARPDPH